MSTWARAPLGQVTRILSGTTPDSANPLYWTGGTNVWVTPTDLGKLKSWDVVGSVRMITDAALEKSNLPLVPAGAVVMSSRAPIGHLAIAGCDLHTNQGCKSFVCGEHLVSEFLFLSLRHHMPSIQALGSGATFLEVSKSALAKFDISFPDIVSQRRIAARLKAQLAAVEQAREAARAQIADVEALQQAVYRDAFHDIVPVSIPPHFDPPPEGWSWQALVDVARLESGHTPSRARPDWWGGDVSWMSLTEIRALDGQWVEQTQIRTNPEGIAHSAARILPRGTVCYSRTASVGFVAIMARPMTTSQDFANWVCGDDLDPEFLMHALVCARESLRALATGATHKTIYMPTLKQFHVCLPSRAVQQRIVAELKQRLAAVERMQCATQVQLADLQALPARLLAQAFDLDGDVAGADGLAREKIGAGVLP